MDHKQITKKIIEFNKTAFDNTFNATRVMQEQTERLISSFSERAQWLPEQGKKAVSELVKTNKKRREEFKSYVDDNYRKVNDFFAGIKTEETAQTGKK